MTPWSQVTAGGAATAWSRSTGTAFNWTEEFGSDTTWPALNPSRNSYGWLPLSAVTDLWQGVDFVPTAVIAAPAKASTLRPVVVYNLSAITASGYTAERHP